MIKFFKKIRFELLENNKTGKYLKYAIGEILLVIIGILIAVSINGWNEDRKGKIEEQSILKDLKQEVAMNLEALELTTGENEKSFEAAKAMRALFRDREAYDKMPDSTFLSMVGKMNTNYTYDPRNGILNSIISSGQINQLSNKELKYLLASLKDMTTDALEDSKKIEEQRDPLWHSIFENARVYEDGKIIGLNAKSFYDIGSFRTLTWKLFHDVRKNGLEEEHELIETLKHIIELIDQEIEK